MDTDNDRISIARRRENRFLFEGRISASPPSRFATGCEGLRLIWPSHSGEAPTRSKSAGVALCYASEIRRPGSTARPLRAQPACSIYVFLLPSLSPLLNLALRGFAHL